jgi:UDP-N-acetylglucosamine 4,6-dehydratase
MNTSIFANKVILITGGTGSFGKAFAKKLLHDDACDKVIIFSRDEWKQWDIQQSDPIFRSKKIRFFLGDVRDRERLKLAFDQVDYIIHAAALKQVPAAEYNPSEFIKTNVHGAMNIIGSAIEQGVKKVLALSTDKAVNPINLYGATKLCSDKLFTAGNVYVGTRLEPRFSVVRYGNVLGSRGSVVPYWQKLINDGAKELPITDMQMTRFWITLDQAVEFVMESLKDMNGGEIFVPKIPSMRIADLGHAISTEVSFKVTGIRPGEKLHELLISSEESRHAVECQNYYIILPEHVAYNEELRTKFLSGKTCSRLPDKFIYSSDQNSEWILQEQVRRYLHLT